MEYFYCNVISVFRNLECGTLHCQGGVNKPLIDQSTYSSHTQTVEGKEVQCKVASVMSYNNPKMGGGSGIGIISTGPGLPGGPGGFGMPDPGMVEDGTKCGDERV